MSYASRLLAVVGDGGRAALRRRREIARHGERCEAQAVAVELDRVSADDVAEEANGHLGFLTEPHRHVPETERVPRIDGRRPPRTLNRRAVVEDPEGNIFAICQAAATVLPPQEPED